MLHSLKLFTICFKITVDYRFSAQLKRKMSLSYNGKGFHREYFFTIFLENQARAT